MGDGKSPIGNLAPLKADGKQKPPSSTSHAKPGFYAGLSGGWGLAQGGNAANNFHNVASLVQTGTAGVSHGVGEGFTVGTAGFSLAEAVGTWIQTGMYLSERTDIQRKRDKILPAVAGTATPSKKEFHRSNKAAPDDSDDSMAELRNVVHNANVSVAQREVDHEQKSWEAKRAQTGIAFVRDGVVQAAGVGNSLAKVASTLSHGAVAVVGAVAQIVGSAISAVGGALHVAQGVYEVVANRTREKHSEAMTAEFEDLAQHAAKDELEQLLRGKAAAKYGHEVSEMDGAERATLENLYLQIYQSRRDTEKSNTEKHRVAGFRGGVRIGYGSVGAGIGIAGLAVAAASGPGAPVVLGVLAAAGAVAAVGWLGYSLYRVISGKNAENEQAIIQERHTQAANDIGNNLAVMEKELAHKFNPVLATRILLEHLKWPKSDADENFSTKMRRKLATFYLDKLGMPAETIKSIKTLVSAGGDDSLTQAESLLSKYVGGTIAT
jgi:hypothetical protein